MEYRQNPYKVYVNTDDAGRIVAITSDAFLTDVDGWVQIDEGYGDKYHHAMGNYFPQPIRSRQGVCRYKLVDGVAVERTAEEIAADSVKPEAPSIEKRVGTVEDKTAELEEALEMLLSGVTE